jgi:hypothetical protein
MWCRLRISLLVACVSSVGPLGAADADSGRPPIADPFVVMTELDRLAAQPLWPGYDSAAYPVAIFTGEQTLLFRHPAPPDGFQPHPDREGVFVHAGRYPAVRSNSNAVIGGVTTATLMLTFRPGRPETEEASILIHELFHVYQRQAFPDLRPNEAHRFTYPVTDVENYRLTLEEDRALARAVESVNLEDAAGWAALAMSIRGHRVERLADEHRDFETDVEMKEGTAFYLAHLSMGLARSTDKLQQTLPPDQFRWRPYATGGAIAALLDRFATGWKQRLNDDPELTLGSLLDQALDTLSLEPARFTDAELAGLRCTAEIAVAELEAVRNEHLERVLSHDTWSIAVEVADGVEPFGFENLDPLSLMVVGDGQLVHGHLLRVESEAGFVALDNPHAVRREIVGINAITVVGEGEHPLYGGVRRVTVSGFESRPEVSQDGQRVRVTAEGIEVEVGPATVVQTGMKTTVTVLAPVETSSQ